MDPTRMKGKYPRASFEKALVKEIKNSRHHLSGVHRFNKYVMVIYKTANK